MGGETVDSKLLMKFLKNNAMIFHFSVNEQFTEAAESTLLMKSIQINVVITLMCKLAICGGQNS
jgi:hypothetical protein